MKKFYFYHSEHDGRGVRKGNGKREGWLVGEGEDWVTRVGSASSLSTKLIILLIEFYTLLIIFLLHDKFSEIILYGYVAHMILYVIIIRGKARLLL